MAPVDSSQIPTQHIYKISRDGTYLGELENVTSEFGYQHEINTVMVSLNISVKNTINTAQQATEPLLTESGLEIQTEDDQPLLTERAPDIVGNTSGSALIRNNNDIEVVEISRDHPNGKVVFEGFISKWRARIGGSDDIQITCLSYGHELKNYLAQSNATADQSQPATNNAVRLAKTVDFGATLEWEKAGQAFTTGASVTNVSAVKVKLGTNPDGLGQEITLTLWPSVAAANASSGALGSVTQYVGAAAATEYTFTFASPISVTPSSTYFFTVETQGMSLTNPGVYISYQTGIYAVNKMYFASYAGGSGGGSYVATPIGSISSESALYFTTYSTTGAVNDPHLSQELSSIIEQVMDSYVSRGGAVTYTPSSIDSTGVTASLTFKLNTLEEVLDKVLNIAPANWYYYVSPQDSILHFHQASATADYIFVLGRDVIELDIEATIEKLKNIVYFTGGDTGGGQNLLVTGTDTASINSGDRVGLERLADNRVTVVSTGEQIVSSFLDENAEEKYITSVTVTRGRTDLTLVMPGKTIGFAGYGTFIDNLVLPVVAVDRKRDTLKLNVGILPKRVAADLEEAKEEVLEVQTVDNPDEPA